MTNVTLDARLPSSTGNSLFFYDPHPRVMPTNSAPREPRPLLLPGVDLALWIRLIVTVLLAISVTLIVLAW